MQYDDAKAIAEILNAATRAGNLAAAYSIVKKLQKPAALAVILAAGHSTTMVGDSGFITQLQASIAGACRARLDGWAYTQEQKKRTEIMSAALDPKITAYLNELDADIVAHGRSDDFVKDMREAHERRQAFELEMAEGKTEPAKMAREALQAVVYGRVISRHAVDKCVAACTAIGEWRGQA